MDPVISLIVPAYNEEEYLPAMLDSVDAARERYRRGPEAVEVVVVDNDSTDRTAEVARERGCRVVHTPADWIGQVRNAGAAEARGRIYCFVDADARIHPDVLNAVEDALADDGVVGGASRIRLERLSIPIVVTWALVMPMIWIFNVDIGVVFCRREDFEEVDGYPDDLPIGEDVDFLFRLRRLGRARGQKFRRLRGVKTHFSMRKYDEYGDWHWFHFFVRLVRYYLGRAEVLDVIDRYWYDAGEKRGRGEGTSSSEGGGRAGEGKGGREGAEEGSEVSDTGR